MASRKWLRLVFLTWILSLFNVGALAAPSACKGPNRNDPGCDGAEEAPSESAASALVDSISVDWLNQKLTLRGSGLLGVTQFTLGGTAALATANVSDTQLDLPFTTAIAAEVSQPGSYVLKADGVDVIAVYFKSRLVDPSATGCPCEGDWSGQFVGMSWWGTPSTECVEIDGSGATNNPGDIAGTVLPDPNDPSLYPHYPVGASFLPGDPLNSSCRLVQVNGDATTNELTNHPINESQQASCAEWLKLNVCESTAPAP